MKKLLFYIDSMQMGGANRVMANLTEYFSSLCYSVILVNDIRTPEGIGEYPISSKVKRLFIMDKTDNGNRIGKNINRIKKLRKLLKEEKPDVAISFMGPPNGRLLIASIGLKTKVIVSVRNDPYREYGKGIRKRIANMLFHLADGCVFQTKDAAAYFDKRIRRKSQIILNPVREEFYSIKRQTNPQNIISVGRLFPQKNHALLIQAFAQVADKYPKEKLIIYGEGELRSELQDLITELNLQDRVILPGQSTNIPQILSNTKVFVLSSDYEGMPNALMEAMAAGVPVIATDCPCGGSRTLIENSDQGILVACGNVEHFANALQNVLGDDELRKRMSTEGKMRAEKFCPNVIFKQWEMYVKSFF